MQRQHSVELDGTLAAIERRIRALKATIEGSGLTIQTQVAEVEVKATRAIEADHLVEHSRSHVKPREHLGLEGS